MPSIGLLDYRTRMFDPYANRLLNPWSSRAYMKKAVPFD